ncbi:MAG: hypothetical protein ACI4BB_00560 [Coprococcus sp.]
MIREERKNGNYVGYEYKEMTVSQDKVSMYMDCYENFGWIMEEGVCLSDRQTTLGQHHVLFRMKRDRKIANKMELTRLQRHFEACAHEIETLENSKTNRAIIGALIVGLIGTAFMAGATFAVVHEPPVIWLCILLAVPGFMGWILPYFIYHRVLKKQTDKLQPLIEAKYEEVYEICEKGHSLL